MLFKELNLTGLSVSLHLTETSHPTENEYNNGTQRNKENISPERGSVIKLFGMEETKDQQHQQTPIPHHIGEETHETNMYFLFPINATVQIKRNLDLAQDFNKEPEKSVSIIIKDPLILMLNHYQIKFLKVLNQHLSSLNIVQRNLHLRPIEPPKENPKAWWKYAYKVVVQHMEKNLIYRSALLPMKMRKYINLYKSKQNIIHAPWLPQLNAHGKKLFETLEEELSLQNLLKFREWAILVIRLEAKRFYASIEYFEIVFQRLK